MLKTEGGFVRAYILGDICPHNISLVRYISFVRCCADIVRTLCGQYMSATISFFGFHLWPLAVFHWCVYAGGLDATAARSSIIGRQAVFIKTIMQGKIT